MTEPAEWYSLLRDLGIAEFVKIASSIPTPRTMAFSQKLLPLIKRALLDPNAAKDRANPRQKPKSPYEAFEQFQKRVILESLAESEAKVNICCFALGHAEDVELACTQLRKLPNATKYLVVIPRRTTLIESVVARSGIDVTLLEWHLDIIPLRDDFFLVPSLRCFRHCFVDSDITEVYSISRALAKLQMFCGAPSRVFVCGSVATRVCDLLEQQKVQIGASYLNPDRTFDEMFIIDRTADLVTPLVAQWIFAGLIDDRYGINAGYLVIGKDDEVDLCEPEDELFPSLRGRQRVDAFNSAFALAREAEQLQEQLHESFGRQYNVTALRAMKVIKMKPNIPKYVKLIEELGDVMQPLSRAAWNLERDLICSGDRPKDTVWNLMAINRVIRALQLFCMSSVIYRGVDKSDLITMQQKLVAQFGLTAVKDVAALERCGLLATRTGWMSFGKLDFAKVRSTFRLFVERDEEPRDESEWDDVDPVYGSGYVPLLVRLVETGLRGMWQKGGEIDKLLDQMGIKDRSVHGEAPLDEGAGVAKKVLVFVIGGVTESEAWIFHVLGKIVFRDQVEFHVGSTGTVTGAKLIRDVCPSLAKQVE
jgi:hypothetical protein